MINIIEEKDCCGCGACIASCPLHIISFKEGTLGAVFPVVDNTKCINCGKCESVCPIINANKEEKAPFEQEAYASYAKDPVIRYKGSSGGMFGVLARRVIEEGGVVFGAAFDENMQLICNSASSVEALEPLYKSKYLQSDFSKAYKQILKLLKKGVLVLVVSTPCQISALKKFLQKDYNNLLTVDFFCHGVPSQKFFDECIAYEDKEQNVQTKKYEFRSKVKDGVTPHYFTKTIQKGKKQVDKTNYYFKSLFYAAFQQYVTLRESCYECKFSSRKRYSDLTIGDFHDIDKYMQGINRFDGVSTVIVNTTKGSEYLNGIKNNLNISQMEIDKLISDGTIFAGSTKRPAHRDEFVRCYVNEGISGLRKSYLAPRRYIKNYIYYSMPGFMRKILKRVLGQI